MVSIIDTGAYLDYQTNANHYVDSCDVAPIIPYASVEQEKVLPGGLMTVTAEAFASSPSGIQSVDADSLTIINVQSYPTVGGNWTVRFNTTGKANLAITAVNGTTWTNPPYECYDEETEIQTRSEINHEISQDYTEKSCGYGLFFHL